MPPPGGHTPPAAPPAPAPVPAATMIHAAAPPEGCEWVNVGGVIVAQRKATPAPAATTSTVTSTGATTVTDEKKGGGGGGVLDFAKKAAVFLGLVLAVIFLVVVFLGGGDESPMKNVRDRMERGADRLAKLPQNVYKDVQGRLRVRREAPDMSGPWERSIIQCNGRTGTFRCNNDQGWCKC